ncbi:hypothetical protein H6503_06165 [Candidatus Woesearchaeota archaeon]|nr:hypothetical protein [Candidatus Woesearchaeota archaeon]
MVDEQEIKNLASSLLSSGVSASMVDAVEKAKEILKHSEKTIQDLNNYDKKIKSMRESDMEIRNIDNEISAVDEEIKEDNAEIEREEHKLEDIDKEIEAAEAQAGLSEPVIEEEQPIIPVAEEPMLGLEPQQEITATERPQVEKDVQESYPESKDESFKENITEAEEPQEITKDMQMETADIEMDGTDNTEATNIEEPAPVADEIHAENQQEAYLQEPSDVPDAPSMQAQDLVDASATEEESVQEAEQNQYANTTEDALQEEVSQASSEIQSYDGEIPKMEEEVDESDIPSIGNDDNVLNSDRPLNELLSSGESSMQQVHTKMNDEIISNAMPDTDDSSHEKAVEDEIAEEIKGENSMDDLIPKDSEN